MWGRGGGGRSSMEKGKRAEATPKVLLVEGHRGDRRLGGKGKQEEQPGTKGQYVG